MSQEKSQTEDHLRQVRIEKLAKIRSLGENPYPYKFEVTHHAGDLQTAYSSLENETETTDSVVVAGRVVSNRNSGMFIDLQDVTGKIQIFSQEGVLNDHSLKILDLVDLGDWIGVKGIVRRTKRGELTINAQELCMLSKALLPLPEKYHGLADIEKRYRQRYLDLIVTEESRTRLRNRSKILQALRGFLIAKGFLEVETPMLQTIPGGAAAKPFITHHNALDMPLYLRIAPELFLKRLIIGGLSAVQQFVRIGDHAIIGGMSGVEKDVIPYGMVMGERAFLNGLNLVGLKRRGFSTETVQALMKLYDQLFDIHSTSPLAQRVVQAKKAFSGHETVESVLHFLESQSKRSFCLPKAYHV